MTNFTRFEICGIEFRVYDGNIGCSFSGGADSAIVVYLLMKYSNKSINFYLTDSKLWPNRLGPALRVFEKCKQLTGYSLDNLIVTVIEDDPHRENIFIRPLEDKSNNVIDFIYSGLTCNPPVELNKDNDRIVFRDIEDGPKNVLDEDNFYMPFRNHHKRDIARLYTHLGLMEDLFPLTYSCTDSQTEIMCGNCWFCFEREWGFGRLL